MNFLCAQLAHNSPVMPAATGGRYTRCIANPPDRQLPPAPARTFPAAAPRAARGAAYPAGTGPAARLVRVRAAALTGGTYAPRGRLKGAERVS